MPLQDTAERLALEEHSKLLAALLRGMTLQEAEQQAQEVTQAVAQRQQQQQQAGEGLAASGDAVNAALGPNVQGRRQRQVSGGLSGEWDLDFEEIADAAGSDSDYSADQVSCGFRHDNAVRPIAPC